jgi:hypothetical protein
MPPPKKKDKKQQALKPIISDVEANYAQRPLGMPTLPVLRTELARLGLPASDAEYLYDRWLTNGFKTKAGKIKNWRAAARNFYREGYFPSQKKHASPDDREAVRERIKRMQDDK